MLSRRPQGLGRCLTWYITVLFICTFSGIGFARHTHPGFILAKINASQGGTFADNPNNPSIKVTIPSGALSADARLIVRPLRRAGHVGPNQAAASPAYRVALLQLNGWRRGSKSKRRPEKLTLNVPMQIEIRADTAPIHPQIGEIASHRNGGWQRMMANFYKASTLSVITQTKNTRGEFRVVHRTIQTRSGADVERGRDLYFNETWTSENYWGGTFQLHDLLNAIDPTTAVNIGAQIDISKVPQPIVDVMLSDDFAAKQAALQDPAITRALIQADAVLGVRGFYADPANPDWMTSVGLICTLCHVKVTKTPFQVVPPPADPTLLPIGMPVLGPPNDELDAGTLLSSTPLVQGDPEGQNLAAYQRWGRGNFDPRFLPNNPIDDGVVNPSQIPPHWNYLDLAEQDYAITWIGILQLRPDNNSLASGPECGIDLPLGVNGAWGTENAIISDFEFGNTLPQWVFDALDFSEQNEPGNAIPEDEYRRKLLDVKAFMESIASPQPGEFDEAKAEAGWALFYGKANCVACHSTAEGTGRTGEYFTNIVENPPQGLLNLGIRVPGLRGLTHTAPYFHDGSAATLPDVIQRYTSPDIPEVPSSLTAGEQAAIVEYLKSL